MHCSTLIDFIALVLRASSRYWCLLPGLFSLIAFLSIQTAGYTDNAQTRFESANKLYEQRKYKEAILAYEQILKEGNVSAPLLYNLANSYYKSGQKGQAVIHYRLAEKLAPRDIDIQTNLRFVRNSIGANENSSNSGLLVPKLLTLNELSVLFSLLFWTCLLLTTASYLSPRLRLKVSKPVVITGIGSLIFGLWLVGQATTQLRRSPGVIIVREAVVRYGPLEESQSHYTLHDGAEVSILDEKDGWVQIKDLTGRQGWLRSNQLGRLNLSGSKSHS